MEVKIENISDVLPFIKEDSGIIVSKRHDHSIIDYVFTTDDMWDSEMALQCRGLKFDIDGNIIGRPFHKFFNIGEKEAPQDIAWELPHTILDKLDGSMVHPVRLNGELIFMTRMGATEKAKQAQSLAHSGVIDLSQHCIDAQMTPVFEFTSPKNRIVVAYSETKLTLLAVRELVSGRYLLQPELEALGQKFGVPVVKALGAIGEFQSFIDRAREEEGIEGYVVAFEHGHRLKLKTKHYTLRHKALASVTLEKNVLEWVLSGAVDDVVPLLAPSIARMLQEYNDSVFDAISRREKEVIEFTDDHRNLPRKEFAAKAKANLDSRIMGAAFAILDDRSPRKFLLDNLSRATGSINRIDAVRDLYGFEWKLEGITLPES